MIFRISLFLLGATASSSVLAFAPSSTLSHSQASALGSSESNLVEPVDISIPYDATVQLAYEASDKSMSFEDFKPKYLAQAVAEVVAKKCGGDAVEEVSEPTQVKKHDFALLFDCDGVILETEELHRFAYNEAFDDFKVTKVCGEKSEAVEWSVGYYDILQNSIGGGIPKMRHYFKQLLQFESNEHGDPTFIEATIPEGLPIPEAFAPAPSADKGFAPPEEKSKKKKKKKKKKKTSIESDGRFSVTLKAADVATGLEALIESIQKRKTDLYKTTVEVSAKARPGLLALMDEALADDSIAVGVCSASTKASAQTVLDATLGADRVTKLDVCILGDDVSEKKPSPMIYNAARDKLGIDLSTKCVVVEDSAVGLKAAKAAGMRCVITYTDSTSDQDFYGMGADAKVPDLENNGKPVTLKAIFDPLRAAFTSETSEDLYPELLNGLKDEAVTAEDEEKFDDDDNLIEDDEEEDEKPEPANPAPNPAPIPEEPPAAPPSRRTLKIKWTQDDMGNFSM